MKRIAIVDIETTGFESRKDLILEIGVVELLLESGETNILFDSIVREKGFGNDHKDSWVLNNSDLDFEDVRDAPTLKSKKAEIQELLFSYHVTAYNSTFDFGFLRARGFKI
ncbi:MAG: exonuclease domain-containing protein, partial [Candidatus Thermoplasmatota archaeon]|nr:exonuclease domain-containing protein [Candidatus Thermoplasmatota archaeon]